MYRTLDIKRKEVDASKDKVDRLHLELENWQYQQGYLKREIRLCKELSTPMLASVETELECKLAATEHVDDLATKHTEAMDVLDREMKEREQMQKHLDSLNRKLQQNSDKLEKKRKFLEEFPTRIAPLKTAAVEMEKLFTPVQQES